MASTTTQCMLTHLRERERERERDDKFHTSRGRPFGKDVPCFWDTYGIFLFDCKYSRGGDMTEVST